MPCVTFLVCKSLIALIVISCPTHRHTHMQYEQDVGLYVPEGKIVTHTLPRSSSP